MKKVLITGSDSFTGKHLAHYLEKHGYDVYGTSLFHENEKQFQCDITDKNAIEKVLQAVQPEYLIHLSGISFSAHGNSEDFYKVNTVGTTNILEALCQLDTKPEKVILAGSATVYGNQGIGVLDESLCPKPVNHYGASKYAMECLAQNYFEKLPLIITRPFNYTGTGQAENFLIPKIVSHFKAGKKSIELGNLHVRREFNDVSFVCEVYKRLLESEKKSEILNICSGRGIKLLDAIAMMNKIAGYEIEVRINPAFVRKNEIESLTGSAEKLFSVVGTVQQKEFEDTLRDMFES
ncbi:NAD-dependent epimerase/dehydratase family protein [Sulfurimonas sp. NWX367]|uniref:NAD-dependent epimerase/dehydratase family protein n=1 Tax=unclassified Sulfurimonas TaxID=2623549 RepID=UPI0032046634